METWLYIQDTEKDVDDSFIELYFLNFWEWFFFVSL